MHHNAVIWAEIGGKASVIQHVVVRRSRVRQCRSNRGIYHSVRAVV